MDDYFFLLAAIQLVQTLGVLQIYLSCEQNIGTKKMNRQKQFVAGKWKVDLEFRRTVQRGLGELEAYKSIPGHHQ